MRTAQVSYAQGHMRLSLALLKESAIRIVGHGPPTGTFTQAKTAENCRFFLKIPFTNFSQAVFAYWKSMTYEVQFSQVFHNFMEKMLRSQQSDKSQEKLQMV